jgi:hypothetical protein
MTTLALENINGSPLLVVKGERCEVYQVAPELRDNAFLQSKQWFVENGGLGLFHFLSIHITN